MKVEVQLIDPDTLTDNAGVCGIDSETPAMPQRVELHHRDPQSHLGVKDAGQRLEVEQEHEQGEATNMFADHSLVRTHMLKIERDQVGCILKHGRW